MQNNKNNYGFALLIIGVLFFIFGFITWANSQLIPYLKEACQLSDTESYLVGTAFFAAYFFMSIPSSYILNKVGYKNGMSIGLFVMSIGAFLFIPAAADRSYPLFLTGLFIIGTGLALLQTASNPYVTVLGPIESAAQRISIMGICNKLAGFIAVNTLGFLFLENIDAIEASVKIASPEEANIILQNLADKVITPYKVIGGSFAVLGLLLLFIKLPEVKEGAEENKETIKSTSVFDHRNLLLGALAIFAYVGAEVISYDAFTTFGVEQGFTKVTASGFAKYTAITMLIGYLLSIVLIPKVIKQKPALIGSCILSILFLAAALLTKGYTSIVFFALLGLSQSAMWPTIWPLALNGLGRHTKLGAAILVMMIVGGAVVMPLMGLLAEAIHSNKIGFIIMIPCWLFILYYAMNGYKSKYVKE
ncbi:MAG: sugar MFS transporter [Taibaiella sp.]|nr:sugar MFS transporter [Taibaiella sp.]